MKTATLPAVRVSPETRALIVSVLKDGESLSTFIEDSAKRQASWRKEDEAFYARALVSAAHAKETGIVYSAEEVMQSLRNILSNKQKEKQALMAKRKAA